MPARTRCAWADRDPLYRAYHDEEWGVPLHDDRMLFEFLVLEGAQAGLSWRTILGKRPRYRQVFRRLRPPPRRTLRRRRRQASAERPRHRAQPPEGVGGHRQRPRRPRAAARSRQPRPPSVVVRGRETDPESLAHAARGAGKDRGGGSDVARSDEAGLPLRRPDDLLRADAG